MFSRLYGKVPSPIVRKATFRSLSIVSTREFSLPINPNLVPTTKPTTNILPTIPTKNDALKALDLTLLSNGSTPQLIKNVEKSHFSGELVQFADPWKAQILDQNVAKNCKVILSCGLGGCSDENSLYESSYPITQLFGDFVDNGSIATYSSVNDSDKRTQRFREGLAYYYDESYINEVESANFFEKVLKDRFFNDKGELKKPEEIERLVMVGFSIGHRENKSHINFLYRKMKELGKNDDEISEYFKKVSLINIGSPVNWEGRKLPKNVVDDLVSGKITPKEAEEYYRENNKSGQLNVDPFPPVKIRQINIGCALDIGTAKSPAHYANFCCNRQVLNSPHNLHRFVRLDADNEEMYLFRSMKKLFDSQSHDVGYKANSKGHNLANYAQAMYENAETFSVIQTMLFSPDVREVKYTNINQITFDPKKTIHPKDKVLLVETVLRALVDNAQNQALRFVSRLLKQESKTGDHNL